MGTCCKGGCEHRDPNREHHCRLVLKGCHSRPDGECYHPCPVIVTSPGNTVRILADKLMKWVGRGEEGKEEGERKGGEWEGRREEGRQERAEYQSSIQKGIMMANPLPT